VEIQIADHRPAFTIALSLAKKLEEPLLPKWEEDMTTMVVEVTKKFFGSLTDQQVRKGMEATVSLLSLGLLVSSEGGIDPENWVATLQSSGIQGASKRAVELVKKCNSLPEEDALWMESDLASGGSDDKRRTLLLRALAAGPDNVSGHRFLTEEIKRREANLRAIKLAEWLLDNTTTGRIVKKNVEDTFGYPHPQSDEVCYHLIPRLCGIPEKLLPSLEADFLAAEGKDQDIQLVGKAYDQAKQRYQALAESVPKPLQPALLYNGKSWFDRFVAKAAKGQKKAAPVETDFGDDEE